MLMTNSRKIMGKQTNGRGPEHSRMDHDGRDLLGDGRVSNHVAYVKSLMFPAHC